MATKADTKAKIGVLGASGYTGSELVRLLLRHPHAEIALLTADRRAGQEMAAVFPQFCALSSCRSFGRSTVSIGVTPRSTSRSARCRTARRKR